MQKQQKLVTDKIRTTDTAMLAPPLHDTELIQQLVSCIRPLLHVT